ncbi:MAG: hypothetical protein KY469_17520 [Actinobacteria bacterium]|nr:hypothetical protein [Actinomycetota bacterium]
MEYRTATIHWDTMSGSGRPSTLHDVEVALEVGWVHVRHEDGETSYPASAVTRIEWGAASGPGIG